MHAHIGFDRAGTIRALDIEDLSGIGPYSVYPRTSVIECNQILGLTGAQYVIANYRARTRVAFQNKNLMSQCRAVGHPIATAITERLVEQAAPRIGMDPRGNAPPQSDPRRCLSAQRRRRASVREAVAPRLSRQAHGADGL